VPGIAADAYLANSSLPNETNPNTDHHNAISVPVLANIAKLAPVKWSMDSCYTHINSNTVDSRVAGQNLAIQKSMPYKNQNCDSIQS